MEYTSGRFHRRTEGNRGGGSQYHRPDEAGVGIAAAGHHSGGQQQYHQFSETHGLHPYYSLLLYGVTWAAATDMPRSNIVDFFRVDAPDTHYLSFGRAWQRLLEWPEEEGFHHHVRRFHHNQLDGGIVVVSAPEDFAYFRDWCGIPTVYMPEGLLVAVGGMHAFVDPRIDVTDNTRESFARGWRTARLALSAKKTIYPAVR